MVKSLTALTELQQWLDQMADCVLQGRLAPYRARVWLQLTVTFPGWRPFRVGSESQLMQLLRLKRQMLQKVGATDYVRTALEAWPFCGHLLAASYRCDVLRGPFRLYPPKQGSLVLVRHRGVWRLRHLGSALLHPQDMPGVIAA